MLHFSGSETGDDLAGPIKASPGTLARNIEKKPPSVVRVVKPRMLAKGARATTVTVKRESAIEERRAERKKQIALLQFLDPSVPEVQIYPRTSQF